MSYRLYSAPDSANIVIHMILEQLQADFEICWVDRSRSEHRQPAYKDSLNPQGLIPVLVDEGTPIFETAAIALHLSDQHRQLAPQQPGSAARAQLLQWLFYLSNTLHADLRVQFYSHRHVSDSHLADSLVTQTRKRVGDHLRLLEEVLSKQPAGPWFLGAELSILDFYLGALCRWAVLYPPGGALVEGRPNSLSRLSELLKALEQLPAVARALRAQQISAPFFTDPSPPELPRHQVC